MLIAPLRIAGKKDQTDTTTGAIAAARAECRKIAGNPHRGPVSPWRSYIYRALTNATKIPYKDGYRISYTNFNMLGMNISGQSHPVRSHTVESDCPPSHQVIQIHVQNGEIL